MNGQEIQKHGLSLQELISRGLEISAPREYGAGALPIPNIASTSGGSNTKG